MSFRKKIADLVECLKEENGLTYTDMECDGKFTRKQISCILKGTPGVSIEKIEEFMKEVFDVKIELTIYEELVKN